MFEEFYNVFSNFNETPLNIREFEDKYLIEVRAIGLNKEDIDINVKNNILTISSKKKESNFKYLRHEFNYDSIYRKVELSNSIDLEKGINAKLDNGILKIILFKNVKEKSIKINFN